MSNVSNFFKWLQQVTTRYIARVFVLIYLLVALFVSGNLALRSWPDNPLRKRLYVGEAERLAALQVTSEGVEALNRALTVAARLPAPDEAARPTRAELDHLGAQLGYARSIFQDTLNVPANLQQWDARSAASATELLLRGRELKRESRAPEEAAGLNRALGTVARLAAVIEAVSSEQPHFAQLAEQMTLARSHVKDAPPIGADPQQWDAKTAAAAADLLRDARKNRERMSSEELDALERARATAARLAVHHAARPSAAQLDELLVQLGQARGLVADAPVIGASPAQWDMKSATHAATLLRAGLEKLESRAVAEIALFDGALTTAANLALTLGEKSEVRAKKADGAAAQASGVSADEFKTLLSKLAEARALVHGSMVIASNPLHWDRSAVNRASDLLRAAREKLESRKLSLQPESSEGGVFTFTWRVIKQTPGIEIQPALSASESARVTVLIADMNNPRAATEGSSEAARSARPLLDKMQDTDFIVLVLALGAWGASAQSLASMAAYLGLRRFNDNWFVFYITRPFLGATLALSFYVVLRGGLMTRDATWSDINHIGYAAIAVLVGFFSTEALENLKRIAKGFFADKEKRDGLDADKPELRGVRWVETPGGDYLELTGEGFGTDAQVWLKGKRLCADWVRHESARELRCELPANKFAVGDPLNVRNPGDAAAKSDDMPVPKLPTGPVISAAVLSPKAAPTELKVSGRRFAEVIVVMVKGAPLAAGVTRKSDTEITVDLTAAGAAIAKGEAVRVTNQGGTGETSNAMAVT